MLLLAAYLGFWPGALALLILLVLLWRVWPEDPLPWRRVAAVLKAVADGRYSERLYLGAETEEELVNQALEELARRLSALAGDRARLLALLDQLDDALLLVDRAHRITLANRAAERLAAGRDLKGVHILSALAHADILRLLEATWAAETAERRAFLFEGRFLEARAHYLPLTEEVLLLVRDRTEERRVNQMRSDFVANVSHELKTPLALIAGYAETLAETELPPEEARRFAAIVQREAERLARLVDDLLTLSKAEAGRLPLVPFRLAAVLARLLHRHLPRAAEKSIELRLSGALDAWALGQLEETDVVLTNLLDNALRHAPPGSRVLLRVERVAQGVAVSVIDQGEGIPEGELARIFERFYRVDKSHRRGQGGAGLGLAIARHLAEAMSGQLDVRSRVGEGATFTLTLVAPETTPAASAYAGQVRRTEHAAELSGGTGGPQGGPPTDGNPGGGTDRRGGGESLRG